jgi:subtilisin family serine protease
VDAVFDAQFRTIKDTFARQGVDIQIAYTPAGDVDYVYAARRLLAREDSVDLVIGERFGRFGFRRAEPGQQPGGNLVVLSTDDLDSGRSTVPEVLDALDTDLPEDDPARLDGRLPVEPDYVVHITRLCPAVEPEVPSGRPDQPWPPPRPAGERKRDVQIGVSDTGLLDPAPHLWLAGVDGEPDLLGPPGPSGLPRIPQFTGHGTFIAGVARCLAPAAGVFVNDHFTMSGAELESVMVAKLEELARRGPDIINLSAGTYTRNNWTLLGFDGFHERHPDVTLVAAAGNDSTDRPFYPAAYEWSVSVGALGTDERHRAWFSNFGDWVDLYALGEGMVNAYATGEYTYQEPPKRPATQTFDGMARWDGTSFAAPLVAGLIAARMARTGESSVDAARAVQAFADGQAVAGVGPALFATDQP